MAVPDARKQFVPLESNPQVFNSMLHDLGSLDSLTFCDVLSISDPDLLAFVPRPVYALVLIMPFSLEKYKQEKEAEEAVQKDYVGDESDDNVCFIRQTIHNACSMWSILHAVCNGEAKKHISKSKILVVPSSSFCAYIHFISPIISTICLTKYRAGFNPLPNSRTSASFPPRLRCSI